MLYAKVNCSHLNPEANRLMANGQLGIEWTKELSKMDERKKIYPLKEPPHPLTKQTQTHTQTHTQNV